MAQVPRFKLDERRTYILLHAALALFVFACFSGGMDNFFAGDDFDWIFDALKTLHHPTYLFTTFQGHFIRPVETLFVLVNLVIAGGNPIAPHLAAICLHVLNVLLLSYALGRLCQNRLAGLLGALFWGVNYKHTEVVFMTYGFSDGFVLLFWLGTILFLLRPRPLLALLCFLFALISKENAVFLPVLLLGYVVLLRPSDQRAWLKRMLPLWLAMFFYLGGRYYLTGGEHSYLTFDGNALPRFWEIMLSHIGPDATYLKQVWLVGQTSLIPGWLAGVLFVGLAVMLWKLPGIYRFGLFWMCLTMLPTVFVAYQTSRYRYIPLLGLGIVVGQGMSDLLAYCRGKNFQNGVRGIGLAFTLIILYFVVGVHAEEQDYAFFGEIHRQAAASFQQDILPAMSKDAQAMAVFLKPAGRKWETELYAQFLLKPWYVPVTYKWAYTRPHGVLGGLASTYSFVSYCAYRSGVHTLFVGVPYAEFQQRLAAGNFYPILHDYATNTFKFAPETVKTELLKYRNDPQFYYFLQPGHFDPTNTGAAYLSL